MNGQLILARRIRLAKRPTAAREARRYVQATITNWPVSVNTSVAVLLTSELVTNAIRYETGPHVTLVIRGLNERFRVEVHDTSSALPVLIPMKTPDEPESGRGLLLVENLADDWGFYPTPAGKAIYFMLRYTRRKQARNEPGVSASHVSAVLARAGYQRADQPRIGEYSGFVVTAEGPTVRVAYQDHESEPGTDMPPGAAVAIEATFEGYAATLRAAGYKVEDSARSDGVRVGLLVTGRQR